jgi:hypothetical protein
MNVKACRCGREYTADGWRALRLVGRQHLGGDAYGELRNCACGSTAMLVPGELLADLAAVFQAEAADTPRESERLRFVASANALTARASLHTSAITSSIPPRAA